jgi:hypothetical protein
VKNTTKATKNGILYVYGINGKLVECDAFFKRKFNVYHTSLRYQKPRATMLPLSII